MQSISRDGHVFYIGTIGISAAASYRSLWLNHRVRETHEEVRSAALTDDLSVVGSSSAFLGLSATDRINQGRISRISGCSAALSMCMHAFRKPHNCVRAL